MTVRNSIKNASQLPRRYFGLHFEEGVAEYQHPNENGGKPYRILLRQNALERMDKSFEGKPIYVHHVDEVNLSELEKEAVGIVVKSFRNELDGKHWVEFVVYGDRGHDAIAKGWKLSNAYVVTEQAGGGRWHNVEYAQEVMNGEHEHLAIVDRPRYENSVIFTPEDFKAYNENLKAERDRRTNSLGEKPMLKLFNRTEVAEAEIKKFLNHTLRLGATGREITLEKLVNEAEEHEKAKKENEDMAAKGEHPMANAEHMVEVEEAGEKKKYNVKDLVAKYNELHKAHGNAAPAADPAESAKLEEEKKDLEKRENALKEQQKKLETEKADLANKTKVFNERKDAADKKDPVETTVEPVTTLADRVELGKKLF